MTLNTPTKQIRFDLKGKTHGGVPTPHMKLYKKNFVEGVQKNISRESKKAIEMTAKEARLLKNYYNSIN